MPSNILPKNARLVVAGDGSVIVIPPVDLRPEILRRSMDNQPRAFTEAYDSWRRDPGALSALEMVDAPFEAMGQYFGDATLDATNSPAWATAAYMLGSGMLGNAPVKGLQKVGKVGKAGLQILDNGITRGQGQLAGLQYLAPFAY